MNSLEKKIAASFSIISFTFLIMTIITFNEVNKLKIISKEIQTHFEPSIKENLTLTSAINAATSSMQSWLLIESNIYTRQWRAAWSIISKKITALDHISTHWVDKDHVYKLNRAFEIFEGFKAQQESIFLLDRESIKNDAYKSSLEINLELKNKLISIFRRILDSQNWQVDKAFKEEEAREVFLRNSAALFLMVSIVGSISLGLLLTRAVILPITRTTELAERISHGDYSINWDFVGGSEQLDIALKKMVLELAEKSKDNERHKIKLAKTNESLRTSNEELTQFSYRTSHDLRAPLITIRRLAEAIQEDIADGNESEANDNLVHVITYVRKLENLVVDILDLAKADVEIEKSSPVNIHELLISIKERLNQTYYENKVTITIDVNPDLEVVVSKVRITQILENLLSNAIKYNDPSKDESTVKVAVFEKDKKYVLVVEDNGVGIPEGYFDKIFLMFQRFHPERCDGSGLGLYIIKKHVGRMHGNIAFSSSNKGTTFTIEIPFIS